MPANALREPTAAVNHILSEAAAAALS